ncbi:hypothetical protein [Frankia sp. KB5]|uniref:hypothetical protein n=1 Tax=Frankia sp. KB5 TaxID=683318 RepID=UPI001F52F98F|nr:hypothetical protein [Frankia sp. KB5]
MGPDRRPRIGGEPLTGSTREVDVAAEGDGDRLPRRPPRAVTDGGGSPGSPGSPGGRG